MPDEPLALATIAPPTQAEDEYDAICATVMESARGRWFLDEYARRNRNADTKLVLAAIERIESVIRGTRDQQAYQSFRIDLLEMAKTIAQTRAEVAEIKPEAQAEGKLAPGTVAGPEAPAPAGSEAFAAAERIQDVVWTMRERGLDPATCEQIEALASSILSASSLRDPNDHRTRKLGEVLQHLERRIGTMLDACVEAARAADVSVPDAARDSAPLRQGSGLDAGGSDTVVEAEPDREPPAGQGSLDSPEATAVASVAISAHAPEPADPTSGPTPAATGSEPDLIDERGADAEAIEANAIASETSLASPLTGDRQDLQAAPAFPAAAVDSEPCDQPWIALATAGPAPMDHAQEAADPSVAQAPVTAVEATADNLEQSWAPEPLPAPPQPETMPAALEIEPLVVIPAGAREVVAPAPATELEHAPIAVEPLFARPSDQPSPANPAAEPPPETAPDPLSGSTAAEPDSAASPAMSATAEAAEIEVPPLATVPVDEGDTSAHALEIGPIAVELPPSPEPVATATADTTTTSQDTAPSEIAPEPATTTAESVTSPAPAALPNLEPTPSSPPELPANLPADARADAASASLSEPTAATSGSASESAPEPVTVATTESAVSFIADVPPDRGEAVASEPDFAASGEGATPTLVAEPVSPSAIEPLPEPSPVPPPDSEPTELATQSGERAPDVHASAPFEPAPIASAPAEPPNTPRETEAQVSPADAPAAAAVDAPAVTPDAGRLPEAQAESSAASENPSRAAAGPAEPAQETDMLSAAWESAVARDDVAAVASPPAAEPPATISEAEPADFLLEPLPLPVAATSPPKSEAIATEPPAEPSVEAIMEIEQELFALAPEGAAPDAFAVPPLLQAEPVATPLPQSPVAAAASITGTVPEPIALATTPPTAPAAAMTPAVVPARPVARPMPRPAPSDPLAALRALSDEERIAVFS